MPTGIGKGTSDAEKERRGRTVYPRDREEVRHRRLSEKVFAGPGYLDIPDPEYPFSGYGQKKYFELAGRLLKEGKLSRSTLQIAEQLALQYEMQHQKASCGQRIPVMCTNNIMKLLALLKLTEDLTPVGGNVSVEPKKNHFAPCGGLAALAKERLRETA